ncbi:two-component sensor histidine kinase [Acidithiobacillus marinus]|uniref:histidine kinase n=1 Tax=Acidithiobacillus marinus TaxID=187490 RepID=A0A2I1DNV6_9PROT|nr:ATP-binding protein [Acidithiobacillus marinus]PKY11558.1 two-component sensor histidine kinase [Acidithiobacillus marinus]
MMFRRGRNLIAQTAWTLGPGIVVLQILTLVIVVLTVLYPLAERSAEDLAGLIVISAQTYQELSPGERPAFLKRLKADNGVEISAHLDRSIHHTHGHIYGWLLSQALGKRLGKPVPVDVLGGAVRTFWVPVSISGKTVWVHFDRGRLASSLPVAMIFVLGFSTLALVLLTMILVRRVLRPLGVISQALRGSLKAPLPTLPPEGAYEFQNILDIFAELRTRLQAMINHQSLLLTGISHDLRSPLARLRMAWELLPANTSARLKEGMLQDIERMDALLGQSLDLGRSMVAKVADFDLMVLMAEVGAEFERAGGRWQAQLPRRYAFRGDREALRRLLSNLLDNAMRYGGGDVHVEFRKMPNQVLIRLCDQGPGIPELEMEKVFEPFIRLDDARGHGEGSGLGLAIARQLAEAQGMRLRLLNGASGGLCAELSWPV